MLAFCRFGTSSSNSISKALNARQRTLGYVVIGTNQMRISRTTEGKHKQAKEVFTLVWQLVCNSCLLLLLVAVKPNLTAYIYIYIHTYLYLYIYKYILDWFCMILGVSFEPLKRHKISRDIEGHLKRRRLSHKWSFRIINILNDHLCNRRRLLKWPSISVVMSASPVLTDGLVARLSTWRFSSDITVVVCVTNEYQAQI